MITLVKSDWTAVAAAVNRRMKELAMGQSDVARKAELSPDTVRKIQNAGADSYRFGTLAAVSRALGWPGDTLDRIADGEDPFAETSAPGRSTGEASSMTDKLLHRLLENQEEMSRRIAEMEKRLGGNRDPDHSD